MWQQNCHRQTQLDNAGTTHYNHSGQDNASKVTRGCTTHHWLDRSRFHHKNNNNNNNNNLTTSLTARLQKKMLDRKGQKESTWPPNPCVKSNPMHTRANLNPTHVMFRSSQFQSRALIGLGVCRLSQSIPPSPVV